MSSYSTIPRLRSFVEYSVIQVVVTQNKNKNSYSYKDAALAIHCTVSQGLLPKVKCF